MTSYQVLYLFAWLNLLVILAAGGIVAIGADQLGLPPVTAAWANLLALIAGGVQSFLPPLQRFPASRDNAGPTANPDPMPRDR